MTTRERIIEEAKAMKLNHYQLYKLTGINKAQIKRYLAKEVDLTGKNIDKLLVALGLHVTKIL